MDQMDYTMDDSHPSRQANNARCQYAPQHLPNLNLGSQSRENQHYDPVHDTNAWHTSNNSVRPPFPPQLNTPQWQPGTFAPSHSWDGSGDLQRGPQSYGVDALREQLDSYGYRSQSGPMGGMSNPTWGGGFEPMSYSYTPPMGTGLEPSTNNNMISNQNSARDDARVSSAPSLYTMPQTFGHGGGTNYQDIQNQLLDSMHVAQLDRNDHSNRERSERSRRETSELTTMENTPSQANHAMIQRQVNLQRAAEARAAHSAPRDTEATALTGEQRAPTHARTARYHSVRTNTHWMDPGPARRRGWDLSDEGEESDDDGPRRHHSQGSQYPDVEDDRDDRAMAALRGMIASSKKVPSKAAIAALEIVKPEDLRDADKTCIICYNDFGEPNPEGLVETALRLPKCKHIFGDTCIKKWFEDSDSCPYCRDKLPSELAMSRGFALESLRTQRDRLAAFTASYANRQRFAFTTGPYTAERAAAAAAASREFLRSEYEGTSNSRSSWEHSPPNRSTPADLAENRRRQPRGRNGRGTTHALRPMSVGSARIMGQMMSHQSSPHRAQVLGSPSSDSARAFARAQGMTASANDIVPGQRTIAAMNRQRSNDETTLTNPNQTPPRNRPSSSTFSSPIEQPSPAVAVGSGGNARNHSTQDSLDLRQVDGTFDSPNEEWGAGPLFTNSGQTNSPPTQTPVNRTSSHGISPEAPPFHPASFGDVNNAASYGGSRDDFFMHHNLNPHASPRWSH